MDKLVINLVFSILFSLDFQTAYVSTRDINIYNISEIYAIEEYNRHDHHYETNCNLNVNRDISNHHSPLFLNLKRSQYLRTNDANGEIEIAEGQRIFVACPGHANKLKVFPEKEAVITCVGNKRFKFPNANTMHAKSIMCHEWPLSKIQRKGNCLSKYALYELGFDISAEFLPLFEFCHDLKTSNTLYTRFSLAREAANGQNHVKRPEWMKANIYGDLPIDLLYKRWHERQTFEKLLGSSELARNYIHDNDDYFLSRGHMTAKADFYYGAQQVNTFFYENAAPQWQTLNGGNWDKIEVAVREKAFQLNQDLEIYTGTFDNDILPNKTGSNVNLRLDIKGKVPVPRIYWKVAHETHRNVGVAIIGLNSPYLSGEDIRKNILCKDICDQITWLHLNNFNRKNPRKGYIYCCDVNEFKERVNTVPDIRVGGVLV